MKRLENCGLLKLSRRLVNALTKCSRAAEVAGMQPLQNYTEEQWKQLAIWDHLHKAPNLGIDGILEFWTAMLDAGITPVYYLNVRLPPRDLKRLKALQEAYKNNPATTTKLCKK